MSEKCECEDKECPKDAGCQCANDEECTCGDQCEHCDEPTENA